MPMPWQETALLASAVISGIGTAQVLLPLPKVLACPNLTQQQKANHTMGAMSACIGTAMSFDGWKQYRNNRLAKEKNRATELNVPNVVASADRKASGKVKLATQSAARRLYPKLSKH